MVDDQALGVVERRLFAGCEVGLAPFHDFADSFFIECISSP
jgi:hypothetical protein